MKHKYFLQICILLALSVSCSQFGEFEQNETDTTGDFKTIIMNVPQTGFEDSEVMTRNVANIGNDVEFVWSVTDSVGIFPDAGSQIYFSMASGAGQVSAAFDGGGWALKKSSEYYSYFPFSADFYINKEAVPLTYVGQTQKGNANENSANIGKYGYMMAKGIADESTGSLYFNYERLGNLFRIKIPVSAGEYTSLEVLTEDDVLLQTGTYNVVNLNPSIDNPIYKSSLKLNLEDVTFDQEGTLIAFIMMAPFDYLNRQLTFKLTDSEGNIAVSSVRGKTYERGMTYGNTPHISISPAEINAISTSSTATFKIVASGNHPYTLSTDVPWLIVQNAPSSGSASINVSVVENTIAQKRVGHIIASETVNGVPLKNIITVTQNGYGDNDQDNNGGLIFKFEDTEMTTGESYTFGDDSNEYTK